MEKSDRRQHINDQKKHKKFYPSKNKQVADDGKTKKPINSSTTTTIGSTINFAFNKQSTTNPTADSGGGVTVDDNDNYDNSSQQRQQFSKRGVESNWQKYEETSDDDHEENAQNLAADFQSLLIAPQSVGSHFVFNTEKDWEILSGEVSGGGGGLDPNQYFQLNLIQLAESLQCIPFNERQNLPNDLFTNDEQIVMTMEANRFKQKLKKNKEIKQIDKTTLPTLNDDDLKIIKQSKSNKDDVDDELDALLSFNVRPQIPRTSDNKQATASSSSLPIKSSGFVQQKQSKQELQQWLDDILDE